MTYKGMNVLVTGGAGFIGSNLVRALLEQGANVTVLDDLYTGDVQNLPPAVPFVNADVRDISRGIFDLNTQDYVFHLAARNIITSLTTPYVDFEVNIGGTLQMLEMLRTSTRLKRFVYASSASVYGNQSFLPVSENVPLDMLSPYAVSKYGGEAYAKVFYEQYKMPITVVRYSNVYGINQRISNPYCGVMAKFVDSIYHNEPVTIFGNGEQTRDFTYIKDAVDATLACGLHPKAEGEIFNVASGVETKINNVVELISGLLPIQATMRYSSKRDIDNIRRRVLNIDKIKNIVGWEPAYTLMQGVKETIAWYIMEQKKANEQTKI